MVPIELDRARLQRLLPDVGASGVYDLKPALRGAAKESLLGSALADFDWVSVDCRCFTDLSALEKLTGLKTLRIEDGKKEQVRGVFKLDRLETLDISRCEIGVGLFRTAATLKLCDLSLLDCEVADLRGLDQLNALEKLDLSGSIRTDAAINELAGLTGLTSLVLDFCNVTIFKAFLGCGDLEHLSLASTEIIDVSLIGRFTHLKELSLAGTSVADLAPLQELSKLTTLDLSWTKPLDLSPIAYLNDLRFIDFTGADLPDLTPFVRSAVPRQIAVDSKSLTSNQRRMLLNASEIEIVERLLK